MVITGDLFKLVHIPPPVLISSGDRSGPYAFYWNAFLFILSLQHYFNSFGFFFILQLEALQRRIFGRRALYQATADTDGTQATGEVAAKPIVTV